VGAENEFISDP